MTFSTVLKTSALALVALCVAVATPACAEWRRAESAHFIVYSQGAERDLRSRVRDLETYDFLLRHRMGLGASQAAARKLPIYLVRDIQELRLINPRSGDYISGVYFPTEIGRASCRERVL